MTALDLDALEKLADDDIKGGFLTTLPPATIKALIAELREARGLLTEWIETAQAQHFDAWFDDDVKKTSAFLARNGKADLQKMQNSAPRNAPRGLSDEC